MLKAMMNININRIITPLDCQDFTIANERKQHLNSHRLYNPFEIVFVHSFVHLYSNLMIIYYNPSVRITVQLLTPLLLSAFIFYVSGGTCSLTSSQNDRYYRNFFMRGSFYSQSFCQKSAEQKSPRDIFIFSF